MADALHYTDDGGFKAIGSQVTWCFLAFQPPGDHPFGAYFTNLHPETPNLAKRLRIPRSKTEFVFAFGGTEGMLPLPGGRGAYIFYSPVNYSVERERQVFAGLSDECEERS